MRPLRRGRFGGFGGVRSVSVRLALALLVGSVVFALGAQSYGGLLLLAPADVVLHLSLWQPLTYCFVETTATGVLFGALVLWQIGGALEQSWGPRRLLAFAIGTTVLAGLLTTGLAFLLGPLFQMRFAGGWVMASALWVGYGLSLGRAQTNFWGLPVSGNILAAIGAAFVLLNGAFNRWPVVPAVLGLLLTAVYVRVGGPELWWLRFQSWRLQRRMRGRSKHLRVVAPDRNTPRDSDRYLH
jgi:hypothetical protein